jgi:hypothetical protein
MGWKFFAALSTAGLHKQLFVLGFERIETLDEFHQSLAELSERGIVLVGTTLSEQLSLFYLTYHIFVHAPPGSYVVRYRTHHAEKCSRASGN